MAKFFPVLLFIIGQFLLIADGRPNRNARLVLDNPADMSTLLGYKDHRIHDMTSLVDEAKAQAHGQSGTGSSSGTGSGAAYNVPNFPGQTGASSSGNNPRTSLSFAGTNLWRCDAHVVEVCDLNCLDVDPKDGCPFCIQSCQQTLHGSAGQGSSSTASQSGSSTQQSGSSSSGSTQSGSGAQSSSGLTGTGAQTGNSQSGSPFQQPSAGSSGTGSQTSISQTGSAGQQPSSGTGSQTGSGQSGSVSQQASGLAGTGTQTGNGQAGSQQPSGLSGTGTQNAGSQSGTLSQQASGLTGTGTGNSQQGSAGQQPSNLAGTGTQSGSGQLPSGLTGTGSGSGGQGASVSAGAQTTVKPACPHYPPNCPAIYTKLVNGCLVCTILQQAGVTAPPTTNQGPTCPPKRCVAPCNVGIVVGADGCPNCKCPDHI